MRKALKALAILFVAGTLTLVGTGVVLAAGVARSGVMTVKVHDRGPDGVNLFVPVPVALLNLGIGTLPMWMPQQELAQVRQELAPWAPTLKEVARQFEECPDVTLVKVETDNETVIVRKVGRSVTVDVRSPDTDVRVSMPADLMSRALNALT